MKERPRTQFFPVVPATLSISTKYRKYVFKPELISKIVLPVFASAILFVPYPGKEEATTCHKQWVGVGLLVTVPGWLWCAALLDHDHDHAYTTSVLLGCIFC